MNNAIYLLNVAVSLSFGVALLLAWQRDNSQAFLRMVGLAFLLHAGLPPAYAALNAPDRWLQTAGLATLVALALLSAGLLAVGVGHLAERPFTPRQRRIGAVALLGLGLVLLPVGLPLALVVPAGLNVLVGAAAAAWLWGRGGAERLAGLLLVLLALNALQVFAFGDVVAERQSLVAALIRLCMGLTLLHAAGRRSADPSAPAPRNRPAPAGAGHCGSPPWAGRRG